MWVIYKMFINSTSFLHVFFKLYKVAIDGGGAHLTKKMANFRKVAVVTGANKGIGFAIVRRLCKEFNGDVILTSRDEKLGREAVQKLEEEGSKPVYCQLDITSSESIENLKKFVLEKYGGLDILVNNAGIAYKHATKAPFLEQATVTMATNFTSTLNVCRALIPIVRPHSRIVNVSSSMGALSRVKPNIQERFINPALTEKELILLTEQYLADVASGNYKEKGWTNTAYGTTKMALTALTKIHAKELASSDKEDVLVNCCHPGWVKTDMSGDMIYPLQGSPLTPDQGAETPVHCALLSPGSPTGEFWKDKKIVQW